MHIFELWQSKSLAPSDQYPGKLPQGHYNDDGTVQFTGAVVKIMESKNIPESKITQLINRNNNNKAGSQIIHDGDLHIYLERKNNVSRVTTIIQY